MTNILNKAIFLAFLSISYLSYSQENKLENTLCINKTISKYSNYSFLRKYNYTITSVSNTHKYHEYFLVSYMPEKFNKLLPSRNASNHSKIDLYYNKVKLIGNHPVFWNENHDTSDFELVMNTMVKYNLIDSFYIKYDKNKSYSFDDFPSYIMNDRALVVYYIIRRQDFKIVRAFKTRRYWRANNYYAKLK